MNQQESSSDVTHEINWSDVGSIKCNTKTDHPGLCPECLKPVQADGPEGPSGSMSLDPGSLPFDRLHCHLDLATIAFLTPNFWLHFLYSAK